MRALPIIGFACASISLIQAQPVPTKGAQVSGLTVDAQDGHPLSRATICFTSTSGQDSRCAETDAQGRFRIDGLRPMTYGYTIARNGYFANDPPLEDLSSTLTLRAGDILSDVKFRLHPAASIEGRLLYADGDPFPGGSVSLFQAGSSGQQSETSSNDLGQYRFGNLKAGDYTVEANVHRAGGDCQYLSTRNERSYTPESTSNQAVAIHLVSGSRSAGHDLVMVEAHPVRVSGRVIWSSYPLPEGFSPVALRSGYRFLRVPAKDSDGSFSICGITPGDYSLSIFGRIRGQSAAASFPITVKDKDIEGVELVPEFSAQIQGRIEVEDDPPPDLTRVQPIIVGATVHSGFIPALKVTPDHAITSEDIYTDEYQFLLGGLPPGAYLKSIRFNGRELVDARLPIQSGTQIENLVFTVSTRAATLEAIVKDEMGKAIPDATVFVQPDPAHIGMDALCIHWRNGTTDQNGAFVFNDLAPGKYRVAAWRQSADLDWEGIRGETAISGTTVEILPSGRATVALTPKN